MSLDYKREYEPGKLIRDTRSTSTKVEEMLKNPTYTFMVMVGFAALGFTFYGAVEVFGLLGLITGWWSYSVVKKAALPLRIPKTSGLIDPNELHPGTGKPVRAAGIIYLGNDIDSHEEIWLSDSMARTHMMFMGTTGSGKTEFLISLVSNALIHGSGFIYVDGKADSGLYAKLYSMARSRGRECDVLVVNFQTGARDVFGAQPYKMSNTLNPFAVGSSGMLTQLVVSLMSTGKGDVWENRAISFVEAIMKPLVFLRDRYGVMLDVSMIRDYFELPRLEELTWTLSDTYAGLEDTLDGMKSYLKNLPTYDRAKYQKQGETANEQHGYISMQLVRTFNSLADTYGYIMRTQLAEIDFLDVFLNRRILIVLLPALEKSPAELTNLGRIVVASIKATMAVGLGARIEGDWNKVIESKPTTAPSPFMCVLDEYGYYAVEGFSVVPAQARSLGFSAIFAGQDLPAFQKASEKEAESTLANTNTKFCGKMTCVKTYKYFSDLAGHGYYTRTGGYVASDNSVLGASYKDGDNASIEKFERVTLDDLQRQKTGKFYMFFEGKIVRMTAFFADYSKQGGRNVSELRVNHFVRVARPNLQEIELHQKAAESFDQAISGPNGLGGVLDTYPVREYMLMGEAFEMFAENGFDELELCLTAVVFSQREDAISDESVDELLNSYRGDADFDGGAIEDNASEIAENSSHDYAGGLQQLGGRTGPRRGVRPRSAINWDESDTDEFPDHEAEGEGRDASVALPRYREGVTEVPYGLGDSYGGEFDEERKRIFQEDSIEQLAGATVYGFSPEEGDEPPIIGPDDEAKQVPVQKARKVKPGLLNRDDTIRGLATIQERLGDSRSEAAVSASVVTGTVADATRYPLSRPTGPTTPDSFVEIALKVSSAFELLDDLVRSKA